jgi:hypothetical protein
MKEDSRDEDGGIDHGMDEFGRTSEDNSLQSINSPEHTERRAKNRKDGVISRIEDITYKVLRQHEDER